MTDRWRKGVTLLAIESVGATVRIGDRLYDDPAVTVPPEDWERICEGRMCIGCYEVHETPWPSVCPMPGCDVTPDEQRRRIESEFGGHKWIGPRETLEDEEARLQEENERRMHRLGQQIWLPKTLKED